MKLSKSIKTWDKTTVNLKCDTMGNTETLKIIREQRPYSSVLRYCLILFPLFLGII